MESNLSPKNKANDIQTPYIIAELGINHDGSIATAESLIRSAAESGVHAVKFQYRNLDSSHTDHSREIGDELLSTEIKKNYISPEGILQLVRYARTLGIECGISFFCEGDIADFSPSLSVFDFFKVPSAELANISLIKTLLNTHKPVYLSTGCHSEKTITTSLEALPKHGWTPLHCVSNYPTRLENARLGYIKHLQKRWDRPVGFSSHDKNWETCLLALQLGATVIERHITLDKNSDGLDHSSSSTPEEFATLCNFARHFEHITRGNGPRIPNQGERLNQQNLGRSYYAVRDINAGQTLGRNDLVYRSPAIGIATNEIDHYLGQTAKHSLKSGLPITPGLFRVQTSLPGTVIDFARQNQIAIPVRIHDLDAFQTLFPIGAFEFHLSYKEVLSEIDISKIDVNNRYSVHLPDYTSSTSLMDPFSPNEAQRNTSLDILDRTCNFARKLQDKCGYSVPIVGSFSQVHQSLPQFYDDHTRLLEKYSEAGIKIFLQWLPPIAWYFGGSVDLNAMNNEIDVEHILARDLPICLDVCHLIMCQNHFSLSAKGIMSKLSSNIGHIHIADAAGTDGEGLMFGDGEPGNMEVINYAFDFDCMKVIEVWQGHLDQGAGFRTALLKLSGYSDA